MRGGGGGGRSKCQIAESDISCCVLLTSCDCDTTNDDGLQRVKEKKGGGQQSYRSYTIAGNHGDRDGTLESGITGLSQLTDIPRSERL